MTLKKSKAIFVLLPQIVPVSCTKSEDTPKMQQKEGM